MDNGSSRPVTGRRVVSRRAFLRFSCGSLLGTAALAVLGPVYATQVEPHWIEVTWVDVSLPKWPKALDGFTIVQLSDLHVGPYVSAEDVRRSVQLANGLDADLVVLTGDFVYRAADYSAPCARELAALRARHGVYAVLGNHDVWTDADVVARNLAGAGIVVLRNERRPLDLGDARLWLLGIEDVGYTGFQGRGFREFQTLWQGATTALARLLDGVPEAEPRLLLVHNPDFVEMRPAGRIDLALCGHTHGGQVRLPFIGAPVVPSCFGQKYAGGLVRGPHTWVYVNRGIGMIALPVRFNCRPEVTLLRLKGR